jgi:hypoxanthine-DNA glycosylase
MILKDSIPNDFPSFFQAHPRIVMVCFNGQKAETLFLRHVKPDLSIPNLSLTVLPSTSPAHAGMRYEQKLALWRQALEKFVT